MSQPEDYYVDPQRRPPTGLLELKGEAPLPTEPEKEPWLKSFKTDLAHRSWAVNAPIAVNNVLETISELSKQGEAPDFNAAQDQYLNLVDAPYRHLLATSATEGELYRRVAMIQREVENKQQLQNAPITAMLASGFVDVASSPWNWLPTTWGLRSIKFGTEFGKSALKGAVSFAASEIVNESILQASQLTRSTKESLTNVGFAAILGGMFGGVGGIYRSAELPFYKKMLSETLDGKIVKFKLNKDFNIEGLNIYDDSAGSMKATFVDMKGSRLMGWGKDGKLSPARPLIWALGKWARNPVVLGLSSKSPTVVWFTGKTYEHNMDVVKNAVMGQNLERSLQSKMRKWEAKGILASVKMNRLYAEYLGLDPNKYATNITKRKFGNFEGKVNFNDFQRQIMIGITSGEPLIDPIMNRGAKELYAEFYEPVTKDLIDLELLAPDIQPAMAVQYINRLYDQNYLITNPVKAKEFLRSQFAETNQKVIEARFKELSLEDEIQQVHGLLEQATNDEAKELFNAQLKELNTQLKAERDALHERTLKGEFSPDMITGEFNKAHPEKSTAKLRPVLNDTDLINSAKDTYETLTKQTEEQILQNMLDSSSFGSGGENPFMPRSLMISDKALYENFFLSSDFASTVRTFNLRMGRLIEMHKMLRQKGWNPEMGSPLAWLAYKVDQDYVAFGNQLEFRHKAELEGVTGKELEKLELKHKHENLALNEEMNRDLKILRTTYQRITGTVPKTNKELLQMARISNNYAYATQLGALTLLQTQDLVSPIFNHGVDKWIRGGVIPFIDQVAFLSKKHGEAVNEWMRDITVGIEIESALYGLAHDTRDVIEFKTSWLDRNMAKAATAMGLVNLSSAYGTLATKIAANTSMASNMRRLSKLMEGKLGKSDAIQLGKLGLRDEKIAAVIWDQFKKHGEKIRGSYIPGWQKWGTTETDAAYQKLVMEVKDTFMNAIKQDINSTIFTGSNIASYPLELDPQGLNKAFLTYMGWIFNATSNYTIPLFQRFDKNRIEGAMAMYFAACTVSPLRELIKGKEPDLEPSTLFKKGILDSGILGLPVSLFNTANSMGRVFNDLQLSRYKYRDRGLTFGAGAPMMLAQGMVNIAGQLWNNDWNHKELEELTRLIPLAQAMEFRAILNKAIESLALEEKPQRGKD